MRRMGAEAIYPKRSVSRPEVGAKKYPSLLRDVVIERPDQVWAADITYIRMKHGFIYLVAIMDWFSRYVLAWAVSITMEVDFCVEALGHALRTGKPEIFNTDQGSQFTSRSFTELLEAEGVMISMDGRGPL
jgi:putative transposase